MKNIRQKPANDTLDNRMKISNHQIKVPKSKLSTGSLVGLYPVVLDGGKTIIYISDKSRESEIRLKYTLQKEKEISSVEELV
jgi:hypothetical protein